MFVNTSALDLKVYSLSSAAPQRKFLLKFHEILGQVKPFFITVTHDRYLHMAAARPSHPQWSPCGGAGSWGKLAACDFIHLFMTIHEYA